jgi:hypothetical protein
VVNFSNFEANMMQALIFPSVEFKTRITKQRTQIFDVFRNKYVVLTPEEWVRQHLAHYLVNHMNYPKGLMHLEASLNYNQLQKRADIVQYDKSGSPWMICECKQPSVKLNQDVFDQAAVYNLEFKVPYLLISNGLELRCAQIDFENQRIQMLKSLPYCM